MHSHIDIESIVISTHIRCINDNNHFRQWFGNIDERWNLNQTILTWKNNILPTRQNMKVAFIKKISLSKERFLQDGWSQALGVHQKTICTTFKGTNIHVFFQDLTSPSIIWEVALTRRYALKQYSIHYVWAYGCPTSYFL